MLHAASVKIASEAASFHQRFETMAWQDASAVDTFAMDLFHWQAKNVAIYAAYLSALRIQPESITQLYDIPALPLAFFKSHSVKAWDFGAVAHFSSSTTTGQTPAIHALSDLSFYERHSRSLFESAYGPLSDWVILALLPSYLERGGSSLVYMIDHFIKAGNHIESGFFLYDYKGLHASYKRAKSQGKKVLLWGVSYALLDLAESEDAFALEADDMLMETGGMKGRRRELVREELHEILRSAFAVNQVHSEYGMTELLSQAYSAGAGIYNRVPSLKVNIRDTHDPFTLLPMGKTGGVNLIDLANIDSCAFLQTQDLGRILPDGQFEILGRFDHSELRGCNLMAG